MIRWLGYVLVLCSVAWLGWYRWGMSGSYDTDPRAIEHTPVQHTVEYEMDIAQALF